MGGLCHLPAPVSHLPPSLLAPIAGNFLTDLRHIKPAQGHWFHEEADPREFRSVGHRREQCAQVSDAEIKHMNVKSKKNQRLFYNLALLEDGDVTSSL